MMAVLSGYCFYKVKKGFKHEHRAKYETSRTFVMYF